MKCTNSNIMNRHKKPPAEDKHFGNIRIRIFLGSKLQYRKSGRKCHLYINRKKGCHKYTPVATFDNKIQFST